MKGFLVVDRLNDIHFVDTDKEFARHINEQAKESGLFSEDNNDIYTVDPNIVMQQFSPLIMSQWFLIDHAKNPCTSISCENGFQYVFKHFEDLLIIAINGDGLESEAFLTRKCLVFIKLVGFLYGPVVEEIGKPRFSDKQSRWKYLRNILSTWTFLANNEQSFLVEAVERLHVNQMVNEQCIELLQSALSLMQTAGEKQCQHAMLIVNSKLLALFSNRSAQDLQSVDILLVILLVRGLFPTTERLEDLFAQPPTSHPAYVRSPATVRVPGGHTDRYESAIEGFTTGDETEEDQEQYFSAKESPSGFGGRKKTPYPEVSERVVSPTDSSQSDTSDSSRPTVEISTTEETSGSRLHPTEPARSQSASGIYEKKTRPDNLESIGRGRSRSLLDQTTPDSVSCSGKSHSDSHLPHAPVDDISPDSQEPTPADQDYIKQTVFLTTQMCRHSPYQLHAKRLYPGVVLVVLSEMPKASQANRLVQLLTILKDLISGQKDSVNRSYGQYLYDMMQTQVNKILTAMKKAKGKLEHLCSDVKKKWDNEDLKSGILSYLEQGSGIEITPSLERSLKALQGKLLEIFLYLYLYPRPPTAGLVTTMENIQQKVNKSLGDYKDYLMVKAQRNITMTTYIEDFPGLVHFIYVNRRTNQIMAPSLNITTSDTGTSQDATQLLKDKIWSMMEWMQMKLHEGYTSVTAREGDYHFSYFLWFENSSGEPEVVQRPYRVDHAAPPPGVLTGNFYKFLTHRCFPNVVPNSVHCNEILMMHVGLAPSQFIANHCRQLAAVLWESSGEAYTTSSLL